LNKREIAGADECRERPMTRILIADDHEVVRSGLRSILETRSGWEIVGEAADGKDALRKAIQLKPDVVILDYSLPLINGVEATRQIRTRAPTVEILIFTMHDNEKLIYDLLKAGARGFLLKSEAKNSLFAALESVSVHRPYLTARVSETLLQSYLNSASPEPDLISPQECKVVQLVAEGNSNKRVSMILNISVKTVETHRSAAMRKLGLPGVAALVRYAIRNRLIEA
jgi:DNA-binding NarL/FixJ family response regulator